MRHLKAGRKLNRSAPHRRALFRNMVTALLERERIGHVREALDSLSERDREVLLLWDAGQSYSEIARQAKLAVGAVGTTLARARRRLAEAFAQEEQIDVAR